MYDNENTADEGLRAGEGDSEVLSNAAGLDTPANKGLYSEGSSNFLGGSEQEGGANTFDATDKPGSANVSPHAKNDSGGGLSEDSRKGM